MRANLAIIVLEILVMDVDRWNFAWSNNVLVWFFDDFECAKRAPKAFGKMEEATFAEYISHPIMWIGVYSN